MNIALLESLGISDDTLDALTAPLRAAGHRLAFFSRTEDEAKLTEECRDADAVVLANMPLPGGVIRSSERLKFIAVAFTGVDHIDLAAAREKGVAVSNAAGYATEAVAELAVGQMIALLRNVHAVEAQCRRNGTKNGLIDRELAGRTVGVIGTGEIGQRVARLCGAFGCRVLGYAPRPKPEAERWLTYVPLETLLRSSDIVTLHCPLNAETRGMIGAPELALMKPDAYLVNLARGPVVDAGALADALNACRLAGAAIDVFEQEPPIAQHHPLLNARNCRVTPHIGFATEEALALRARLTFDALNAWLRGESLNRVL